MENINKIEIGNRIRTLREAKNETQDDLKKILKFNNHQQVSYIERGDRLPTIEQIYILAEHYKVSSDYLIGLTNVATNDKDLQFVCEYTGLNERTINFFSTNKSNVKDPYFLDEMFEFFELFVSRVSQKPTISVELMNMRDNTTIYDDLLANFTINVNKEIANDASNGIEIEKAIKNAVLSKYGFEKEKLEDVKDSIDASKYKAIKFFNRLINEFAVSCVEGLTDFELEERTADCYKWGLFI